MKLPDPLDGSDGSYRYLAGPGIEDALRQGLLEGIDADEAIAREQLQPATLDLRVGDVPEWGEVRDLFSDDYSPPVRDGKHLLLPPRSEVDVSLTTPLRVSAQSEGFLNLELDSRSSGYRIGTHVPRPGERTREGDATCIANATGNLIRVELDEKLPQAYVLALPFADDPHGHAPGNHRIGEQVRELNMGVRVTDPAAVRKLAADGHLVMRPRLELLEHYVVFRASRTALRFPEIGTVDFARRKEYEELLEPVDLRDGHVKASGEHLILRSQHTFALSPHVGLRFYQLAEQQGYPMRPFTNAQFHALTFSWADPGYGLRIEGGGGLSAWPKWNDPLAVREGDIVGLAEMVWFPKGVGKIYGDEGFGSQYARNGNSVLS